MKVIWTDFAIDRLKDIFDYYSLKVNKETAHKIRKQILESTKQLNNNPFSGQIEINLSKLNKDYRYVISGNYKVIYRVSKNQISINDVFDTRQNPVKLDREK